MKFSIFLITLCFGFSAFAQKTDIFLRCGEMEVGDVRAAVEGLDAAELNRTAAVFVGNHNTLMILKEILILRNKAWTKQNIDLSPLVNDDLKLFDKQIRRCKVAVDEISRVARQLAASCPQAIPELTSPVYSKNYAVDCMSETREEQLAATANYSAEELLHLSAFQYGSFNGFAAYEDDYKTPELLVDIYAKLAMNCYDLSSESEWRSRKLTYRQPVCKFIPAQK